MLTLYEYEARMYSFQLSEIDKEKDMHFQAWLNQQVAGTKDVGGKSKPVYSTFKSFFDYEKREQEVNMEYGIVPKLSIHHKNLAQIARRANERR